jgi:large subunit ribosomal protein L18
MASKTASRHALRARRQRRVRKKVAGTADRPRLAVFRSNKHISAQLIDDATGQTLATASTYEGGVRSEGGTGTVAAASKVGKLVAERATSAGVDTVVFDRGGNRYHGRVAALADAAREAGLKF